MELGSALERSMVLGVLGFEALAPPCPSLSSFLKAQPCMSVTVVTKEVSSSLSPIGGRPLPGPWP